MGWLFQVLQLVALLRSEANIIKLMSVIHSLFIHPLAKYAQWFLQNVRKEGQAEGPGCGFCKQVWLFRVSAQCQEADWGIHSLGN